MTQTNPILIVAESRADYGFGHLKRAEVVATGLQRAGWTVRLLLTDVTRRSILGGAVTVDARPADLALQDCKKDTVVLFDLPYGPPRDTLTKHVSSRQRVIIDDTGRAPVAAFGVYNPNLYFSEDLYADWLVRSLTGGPHGLLLDPVFFADGGGPRSDSAACLFLSGRDALDTQIALAQRVYGQCGLRVSVPQPPTVSTQTVASADGVTVVPVSSPADMANLLRQSRYFIGGAGQTALQALVCGNRLAIAPVADDQSANLQALEARGAILFEMEDPASLFAATARLQGMEQTPVRSDLQCGLSALSTVLKRCAAALSEL